MDSGFVPDLVQYFIWQLNKQSSQDVGKITIDDVVQNHEDQEIESRWTNAMYVPRVLAFIVPACNCSYLIDKHLVLPKHARQHVIIICMGYPKNENLRI